MLVGVVELTELLLSLWLWLLLLLLLWLKFQRWNQDFESVVGVVTADKLSCCCCCCGICCGDGLDDVDDESIDCCLSFDVNLRLRNFGVENAVFLNEFILDLICWLRFIELFDVKLILSCSVDDCAVRVTGLFRFW